MANRQDLPQVLGARIRELRTQDEVTADEVAASARHYGLKWQRSTVATLEAGRRGFSAEELLLLPLVLQRAGVGGYIRLEDLLHREAALTDRILVQPEGFRQVLTGGIPTLAYWQGPATSEDFDIASGFKRWREVFTQLPGDLLGELVLAAEEDMSGEAEQKAARRLGYTALQVSAAAHRRWGRGLTQERDARVAARGQKGSVAAARGWVTRELDKELLDELHDFRKGDS